MSVTRRNRRELCSLEKAFADDGLLQVHHVVLGITSEPKTDKPGQYKTAPLSWKLTEAQKEYIQNWATARDKPTQITIDDALRWVEKKMDTAKGASASTSATSNETSDDLPACGTVDQTYMRR